MKEPVYVVTSFHRSGSSMMMRCLEAGGIEPIRDSSLDDMANAPWYYWGNHGYVPNPNGFYYKQDYDFNWPSFYGDSIGKAVKVPRLTLPMLPPGAYRMLYMVRNPEEILASMRSYIPFRSWGDPEVAVHFYELVRKATIEKLLARGDFEILEVSYNAILENPEREFQKIRSFGFPIDVQKAAAKVDLSLYRHRLN